LLINALLISISSSFDFINFSFEIAINRFQFKNFSFKCTNLVFFIFDSVFSVDNLIGKLDKTFFCISSLSVAIEGIQFESVEIILLIKFFVDLKYLFVDLVNEFSVCAVEVGWIGRVEVALVVVRVLQLPADDEDGVHFVVQQHTRLRGLHCCGAQIIEGLAVEFDVPLLLSHEVVQQHGRLVHVFILQLHTQVTLHEVHFVVDGVYFLH